MQEEITSPAAGWRSKYVRSAEEQRADSIGEGVCLVTGYVALQA
jgi:hypothetical protein